MNILTYNIPLALAVAYRGRNTVVRARDPSELVYGLTAADLKRLSYVQVVAPGRGVEALRSWAPPVPVDVVMRHPERDFPLLYEYTPLLGRRPVRVSIAAVPGFDKAARLASALQLPVKLEVVQPDQASLEALLRVADHYLHHATAAQPIEFLHSLFLAFYRGGRITLWELQEEDPALFRYLTEQGDEVLSGRLPEIRLGGDGASFVTRHKAKLLAAGAECCGCDFFDTCAGYFKLPSSQYECGGVRRLLQSLREAAQELTRDLAALPRRKGRRS